MQIDYCYDMQPLGSLEIEDLGNCFIEANTDLNERYYFAAITKYGITRMIMYGPVFDAQDLILKYKVTYEKLDYDIRKLKKALYAMLNNTSYKITQAKVIEKEEFIDNFYSPLDIFDSKADIIPELE